MQPTLSVIIACRNAADTLPAQLSALAAQRTDFFWDVLICDNGSTDDTVAVAEGFKDRLPSLRVIKAADRAGAGYARNVGAASTRAPLLAFCDADDVVGTGWVAAMAAGLREHRFVAGRFDAHRLNPADVVRSRPLQQDHELQTSPFGPDLPHAGGGNLGVHRSVFLGVGGFDPAVTCLEDTDLCWRIQLSGVPLVFWPSAVLHVRLRSSLRGMWSQGRNYGEAAALLTYRYPQRPQMALVPAQAGPPVSRVRKLLGLIGAQRNLGGLLWTLGWHVGHRSWTPEGRQVVQITTVTPIPAQAGPAPSTSPAAATDATGTHHRQAG